MANKRTAASVFLKRLARGGVKSIPLASGLVEEMIFGTLDELAARDEAAKLNTALDEIRQGIDEQSTSMAQVLERVSAEADFRQETRTIVGQLVAALHDVDKAPVPAEMQRSVESLLERHGQQLGDVTADLEAQVTRLEDVLSRIEVAQPTPGATAAAPAIDRVSMISMLNGLDPADLSGLVVALNASGYVTESGPRQRVAGLVRWAESTSGPGLAGVYRVATRLVPNFGSDRPDPAGDFTEPQPAAGGLPPVWNVPHGRNRNFTGRVGLLENLRAALTSGRPTAVTQAISGLGGVGKTQLATEYAYRHTFEYEIVWWVRSEEAATLASDYAALAGELGLEIGDGVDQRAIIEAVRRWLEQNGGWLLVFDNAPSRSALGDFLPRGTAGHVLITSRDPNWGAVAATLAVVVFDRAESVAFLLRRTGEMDENSANALAEELGDLPLALEQAAAYVEAKGGSIGRYLDLFGQRWKELLARGESPVDYDYTVATTWAMSFHGVEEASPVAADLLRLVAFLAPDNAPRSLLSEEAEHLPEPLRSVAGDALALDEAVAALRRYSLVEATAESLSVHRMVQAVVRDGLSQDEKKSWAGAAVELVNRAFPYRQNDVATWAGSARLLPYALAAAGHAEDVGVAPEASGRLLNQAGSYLEVRAQLAEARTAYERALAMDEATYGPDHPTVAIRVNNLGYVLQEQGDLEGARRHFERALAIFESAYGRDHPSVATGVNNLGLVLQDLGDVEGAWGHFERALAIDEAAYGRDHPGVATDVNNLGSVLQEQGDLAGARAHVERALRIFQQLLGDDHPSTKIARDNLHVLGER